MHDFTDDRPQPTLAFSSSWIDDPAAPEPIFGSATVFQLEGDCFGTMLEVVQLSLSEQGVEGTIDGPVEPGTVVSLGFEAPGHPARRGAVIGCIRCEHGWKVGIEFDGRDAA